MPVLRADVAIIGGGIVGLATAYQLGRRFPGRRIVVLEKELAVAQHQSGRNSGVLHSGIYYKPGSLKSINCREGKRAMEAFCETEDIPFERCGKVIVATHANEQSRLDVLLERGRNNGVPCERIGPDRLREIEPHAAGLAAIHVPEAGIVDYPSVCLRLADKVREGGHKILLGAAVTSLVTSGGLTIVESTIGPVAANVVVNCAGLFADRIARMSGTRLDVKIVPFRGEFYTLRPSAVPLVKALIYPVPDPRFPFLGVHFTRRIGGGVECGPNAVVALAREGYTRTTINLGELAESLSYPGFLRMAARHWRTGADEIWRSLSKAAFVRALQRLVPELAIDDLAPAPSGVRAQAVTADGTLVDDFLIDDSGGVINVLNAPSPAATSALNIGNLIADRVATRWK